MPSACIEAVAKEVASFGIDFLLVGPTRTSFGAGLDQAVPMPVYHATPAGEIRQALVGYSFEIKGDAARTVDAMIAAADAARRCA